MGIQHGHAARTCIKDVQQGYAAWTSSTDMRHGHAAWTFWMDGASSLYYHHHIKSNEQYSHLRLKVVTAVRMVGTLAPDTSPCLSSLISWTPLGIL
jgi:hypothetical protein